MRCSAIGPTGWSTSLPAVRDPVGRAYNRTKHLPERRDMMQRWADYLDGPKERRRGGAAAWPPGLTWRITTDANPERPQAKPTHPGAVLRQDVLPALPMTQTELARWLGYRV